MAIRMVPRRTDAWLLAALPFAAACGTRTGLDTPAAVADEVTFDAGAAGCQGQPPPWLLFDRTVDTGGHVREGIYAMRVDGTAGHEVTLPHAPAFFPSVSPDGSKLLYATYLPPEAGADGGDDSALYLYDFASRSSTRIVTTSQLTYSALAPDGHTVAYVSGYSLKAISPDGTGDRTLLAGPNDGSGYGHPTFAADPHRVLYATGGVMGAIGIDGSNDQTLLTAIPGSFQYPNPGVSPDHQRIAVGLFCSQALPLALRVYSLASLPGATCESGQVLVQVTEGAAPNRANDPTWGTNGLIAYGSGKDVFVIDANGGTPRNMTAALTGDAGTVQTSDPVWAPGCAAVP